MMNLRNIDLNLLVILDKLLEEGHVGRAAERLGLSQPAASNALARLRKLFDDPLLVRSPPAGLRRTPRADAIRDPLRAALADLALVVATEPPELGDIRGRVRLLSPDVPATVLCAALTVELAKRAPGIDLIFHSWHPGDEVDRLEHGEVDLVLAVSRLFGGSLRSDLLGTWPRVVFFRRDHPAAEASTLDVDRWLAFPHVVVSGRGDLHGAVDGMLARVGLRRRVGVVVPTYLHAMEILSKTDLIGVFPMGVKVAAAATGLTTRTAPIAIDPVSLHLVRHQRTDNDPVVKLVAELICALMPHINEMVTSDAEPVFDND